MSCGIICLFIFFDTKLISFWKRKMKHVSPNFGRPRLRTRFGSSFRWIFFLSKIGTPTGIGIIPKMYVHHHHHGSRARHLLCGLVVGCCSYLRLHFSRSCHRSCSFVFHYVRFFGTNYHGLNGGLRRLRADSKNTPTVWLLHGWKHSWWIFHYLLPWGPPRTQTPLTRCAISTAPKVPRSKIIRNGKTSQRTPGNMMLLLSLLLHGGRDILSPIICSTSGSCGCAALKQIFNSHRLDHG